jgi:hypothetical protein
VRSKPIRSNLLCAGLTLHFFGPVARWKKEDECWRRRPPSCKVKTSCRPCSTITHMDVLTPNVPNLSSAFACF